MKNKLLLLTSDNQAYLKQIEKYNLPNLEILSDNSKSILDSNIWLAEPKLAAPLLNLGKNLTWVQSTFAGVDDLTKQRRKFPFILTNIKNLFGPMMSEYVFSHLLAVYKQHHYYKQYQRLNRWHRLPTRQIKDKRILILGTGDIGTHLCTTANHFGMKTIGINRSGHQAQHFDECYSISQLHQQLPHADVIVCALPATSETKNIFNRDTLSYLKSDVVFINVGRGSVVDEQDLLVWLALHPESHGILDVFKQEPLPENDPLWKCQNATLTPHIAAPSSAKDVVEQFVDNYHRFHTAQPLKNCVDFALGY